MLRKGIAATTVRDVAAEMGSSPGLVHHYFGSMDDLLATAFDQVAAGGSQSTRAAMAAESDQVAMLAEFFRTYTRDDQDWAFQLWLDAWADANRSPCLQATSHRLNVEWQQLLADGDRGRGRGRHVHLLRLRARPGGSSPSSTASPCRPSRTGRAVRPGLGHPLVRGVRRARAGAGAGSARTGLTTPS